MNRRRSPGKDHHGGKESTKNILRGGPFRGGSFRLPRDGSWRDLMFNKTRLGTLNQHRIGARPSGRFSASDSPYSSAIPRAVGRATVKRRERRAPGCGSWRGFIPQSGTHWVLDPGKCRVGPIRNSKIATRNLEGSRRGFSSRRGGVQKDLFAWDCCANKEAVWQPSERPQVLLGPSPGPGPNPGPDPSHGHRHRAQAGLAGARLGQKQSWYL
jgi:hypothetical protein